MSFNTYEIRGIFRVEGIISGFGKMIGAEQKFAATLRSSEQLMKKREASFGRLASSYMHLSNVGREVSGIWKEEARSLDKYHDAAMKVAAVQQRLFTLNLKPEENAKALKGIEDIVKNLRGMQIDEVTANFLDLHSALGSVDHALDLLGDASKYRFNMKSLFGEKFSAEQIDQQILGSFKFLEQTGVMRATGAMGADGKKMFTDSDKRRAQEYFDVISKITAATSGRITGTELQQLAGRGGMSMMGLTPEGLKNLVFIMQEMGGSATGTSLSSAFQKFVGGTMKQSSMKELQSLGLLDLSKTEFNKSGIPKHIKPGAIPIADLLQKDPLAFADALAKAMKEKKGIDPNNIDAVTKELANIVGGQGKTTGNLLAKLIVMRDVIRKDAEIVNNAKGVNEQYAQSLNSIAGKVEELKAARENFRAGIGQGLLGIEGPMMRNLQPVVKQLSDFFLLHPKAARMAAEILLLSKGLSALAKTAAVLRMTGLLGGIGNKTVASGAQPAALQSSLSQILGGNVVVAGAARRTGMGIGGGIAGGIVAGLGVGLALYALGEAVSAHLASAADLQDAKTAGLDLGKSIKEGLLEELRAGTEEARKEIRKVRAPGEAKMRVKSLQIDRGISELDNTRIPKFLGALAALTYGAKSYDKGYGMSPVYGEAGTRAYIAEELKNQQFRSAEDIAAFLKDAKESLTKGGSGDLYMTLEDMMKKLYPGMTEAARMQMDADAKLEASAQQAAQGINSMTTAAGSFVQRVGGGFPTFGGAGGTTGGTPGKLKGLKREFNYFPGRATGGNVMGDGFVKVHSGEDIVPAHITRRLRNEALYAAKGGGASPASSISAPVSIHVDARGASDPMALKSAVLSLLPHIQRELYQIVERAMNDDYRDTALAV